MATIKKAAWNKFYTSELPDVKEARLANAASCEHAVVLLKGAVVAAASQGEAAAEAARAALAAVAEANAEAARAPPNFPVQLAFAPNGAEIAAHTLEGWCQLAPETDIVSCDTRNMYNECCRAVLRGAP